MYNIQANSITGFENESKGPITENEADLRTKVEKYLPQEIAAFIETREDIIECLRGRLRERLRNEQVLLEPELVSELAPAGRVLDTAKEPEQQIHHSEAAILAENSNHQGNHLDFGSLDFSDMLDPLSQDHNNAYEVGYTAGHEAGYQQGQKDGYQAGKKATAGRQSLASNRDTYQQGRAEEGMAILASQPSIREPMDQTSYAGEGAAGFNADILSGLDNSWEDYPWL